jgi:transcription antitermination factor NusG
MDWIIVQLSVWAKNRLTIEDIKNLITNILHQDPLYIYVPVYEDPFGKNDTGFGEYVFINYEEGVDCYVLEGIDEIVRVLKDPHTRKPQLLTSEQIWDIKNKADSEIMLCKEDAVRVISGPHRHNFGVVQFVLGDSINVLVYLGQESLQVTLPVSHVRKSSRRTLLRKRENKEPSFDLHCECNNHSIESKLKFGDLPRVQILRRGIRRTKISIDNKIYQISNEVFDKILLTHDVLDDQVFDEVTRIMSDIHYTEAGE